jgi:hypothetical protein
MTRIPGAMVASLLPAAPAATQGRAGFTTDMSQRIRAVLDASIQFKAAAR